MKSAFVLFGLALSVPSVLGWGATGHQAVGYIAMEFLSPKALAFVKSSLGSTYNESLGAAATWADDVRKQSAYTWSAPLHYVDAEDSPPSACNISEIRDCADGMCILTAIANYTQRVVETSLSATQRQEALKFITHFVGDIGQPLHVEAVAVGGNDIDTKCDGMKINLHALWDSGIINKLMAETYRNSLPTWVSALVSRIKNGAYETEASSWISCSSTTQPALKRRGIAEDITDFLTPQASITPLECPHIWATESNAIDCTTVFNYEEGDDLCATSYYGKVVPIIEHQIAKQGYRLAAWLNVLFDGKTDLP